MKPFFFDIETIPAQDPAIKAELAAAVTAPGQYKKQESINAWLLENRDSEAESGWLKTSFDGGAGHVVVIGWAIGDEPARSYSVSDHTNRDEEACVLQDFFSVITDAGPAHTFIGHNLIGFDLPFLWKRAMVLNVKPPYFFPRNPKPWSELVQDTMLLWDGQQRTGGSMNRICRLMGIPGKGDISGSDVWPMVTTGRIVEVAEYCEQDVERTRAMWKRMTFAESAATSATT